jgi:hypothetical protein
MSKSKKVLHSGLSNQGGLFDTEIVEGALDVDFALRDALTKALSACRESRYQVAAKISELTRHNVSKDMLDKYTSSNPDYDLKAKDLAAFCAVTGSLEPIKAILGPLGCDVATPEDNKLLRLAKKTQELRRMMAEIESLEKETGVKLGR